MSRLKQTRLLFQGIPLSGTTRDALASRCESNWAALEVWGGKGNAKAIQQAGSGRLALCAWIAAKALADNARIEPFVKVSGMSPKDFSALEKLFTEAIKSSRTSKSDPSTPQGNRIYRNFVPSSSGSSPLPNSQDQTPEAKAKRMRDVMSGAAFAPQNSSPIGRRNQVDDTSAPLTPTRRALRDRSTIKEVQIYDPSIENTTPTRKIVAFEASSISHSQSGKRPREVMDDVPASPSKQTKQTVKRRHKLIVGYPGGEPLRKGRFESVGEWDSTRAEQRIKQYIAALERCRDTTGWEEDEVIGQIRLAL